MEMGKFIVFEGIDGAGKTTQSRMLADALRVLGRRVYMTAEPTELKSGRELREVLGEEIPLNSPEILRWIREYLNEQYQN